jgi:hypothetical protein
MREFNIKLTTNNKSGPFDIYYTSEGENVLAPLVNGNYATNISSSQLTTGINILVDYGTSNIYAVNNKETCQSIQNLPQTPKSNPYTCVNLISKNNCNVEKTIQYTDCNGDTQTLTISPLDSVTYLGKINTTTCISSNCDNCITTIPDPQYCKYYRITNRCSDVAVDVKYIDCSGTSKVAKVGPNQTIIIQAIANTIYNYGGDCGTPPDTEEIPDPFNPDPNATCQDFIAVNNCSLDAVISYTDCDGNIATLNIPAGASIPFSSLSPDYKCYSGDCDCIKVFTPSFICGFDFSIDGSYIPTPPVAPIPTYAVEFKDKTRNMNEGESKIVSVTTTNVSPGTILYWKIDGVALPDTQITSADFSNISGTVTINDNKGEFTITSIADTLTEGDELFKINLYDSISYTNRLTFSTPIGLRDTSTTPPLVECGFRAYDINRYNYNYIANFIAPPPHLPAIPSVRREPSSGIFHGYYFTTNNNTNSVDKAMASTRLLPTQFPYIDDFPNISSSNLTGWIGNSVQTIPQSWDPTNSNKFIYPLNQNILFWDNTTYKNTNNSNFYLDGFKADVPNRTVPLIPGGIGNSLYYYLTPRNSTYALTGSVTVSFKGNDTQDPGETDQAGPAVFRLIPVLEKSQDPSNVSSWQKIAYATFPGILGSILEVNPYSPNSTRRNKTAFLYNAAEHLIWYDFDMRNSIELTFNVQTDALIDKNYFVRFTLYWQDLNGVFAGPNDKQRGSNYMNFTIGNSSKPSMFSVIDKTKR